MTGTEPHPELPLDPDAEAIGVTRPLHFQLRHVAAVAFGGLVGTAARDGVTRVWPGTPAGFPWSVLFVNVSGAFVLGLVLETLARRGADEGRRRTLRLLLGAGLCGGFTTYSTLAMATVLLIRADHAGLALAYDVASVIVGLAATAIGIAAASRGHRRRRPLALELHGGER
jgi:fluoride exporter